MKRICSTSASAVLAIMLFAAAAAQAQLQIHPKSEKLPTDMEGPFVNLGDGSVLGVGKTQAGISKDDGNTWETVELFEDKDKFENAEGGSLIRTNKGTIVLAFMNRKEIAFKWNQKQGGPQQDCRLPVYVTRSLDDGRTWETPQMIQDGYCGSMRNLIQTKSGRLVLVSQMAVRDPGRHVTLTYVSDDDGKTWKQGEIIDLGKYGGYGDHGGGIEATIVELTDGRIWMLLRTYRGCFSEAFSDDGGLTWKDVRPSKIEASGSPGKLMRLASGRIVLLWNRFIDPVKRTGRREQLSMAFSEDDGKTWTKPVVVGYDPLKAGDREPQHRLSYPHVLERKPGELWITTGQGNLRIRLKEADFVGDEK